MEMEICFSGGKKVQACFNGYVVSTDQPVAEGGSGTAASPFDLFLASLGTCTGYYVLSFCQKNNISTDNMTMRMSVEKNQETHMVQDILITLKVPKEFPEKYQKAVIRAAEACAVKRHLDKPPKISIMLTS